MLSIGSIGLSTTATPFPAARTANVSGNGERASQTEDGIGADTELSDDEKQEVQQLKQRDQEVRRHEQAHVAAGGQYVQGGPQYEFTRGPDGRQYATGGEVSIDTSAGRTPEETIQKARVVRRAALAPAEPSAQDRRVAAQASQLEVRARQELQEQRAEEAQGEDGGEAGQDAAPARPSGGVFSRQVAQFVPDIGGGPQTLDYRA